jgi:hypothetical protein
MPVFLNPKDSKNVARKGGTAARGGRGGEKDGETATEKRSYSSRPSRGGDTKIWDLGYRV